MIGFITSFVTQAIIDLLEYHLGILEPTDYATMLVVLPIIGFFLSLFINPIHVIPSLFGVFAERILLKEVVLKYLDK